MKGLDLTQTCPRSPGEQLGGYVWLPRIIDKARAFNAGTVGEYNYDCPMDKHFLAFAGIDSRTFAQAVKETDSDQEVLSWFKAHSIPHTDQELRQFNADFSRHAPDSEEKRRHFLELREKVAPGRSDITTWFQLLDADEGRVPAAPKQ